MYKKVIVIGWDGATFDILHPMIRNGYLPTLSQIIQNGSSGILRSVYPPSSAPAWSSFLTGKNPGKHGVFGWYETGRYGIDFVNAGSIKCTTISKILSANDFRLGLINVPMTYPPRPLSGFVIPGMLTPDQYPIPTYPPGLLDNLPRECQPYIIDPPGYLSKQFTHLDTNQHEKQYLKSLQESAQRRTCATKHLIENEQWDVLVAVYTATDRLQHYYWRHIDPQHPKHDPSAAKILLPSITKLFISLDQSIKILMDAAGDDTLVMIVSDHGFGSCTHHLNLTNWLINNGWLVTNSDIRHRFIQRIRRLVHRMDNLNLRRKVTRFETRQRIIRWSTSTPTNWQKTKAYLRSTAEQGIYVNLLGREPQGCVRLGIEYEKLSEDITQALYEIVDPNTGEQVITRVRKGREVYSGQYAFMGPDLLIETKDMHYWNLKLSPSGPLTSVRIPVSGYHRMNGVFLCVGKTVRHHELAQMSILDILPTILYALGIPVPNDLDGRVMTELFTDSHLNTFPLEYTEKLYNEHENFQTITKDEKKAIQDRLEDLGYLG
ncbi:MAG: alkaline phosphatase family protein [Candidatus Kariarchaeaceae archaeon]|jgi:predicted AlkP superfamily phosphohydrolase/phosphomutase